nr:uncharacterized protein LOC111986367 [Quercus suber]
MSLKSLPKVFVRVTPITPALPSQTSEGTQNIVTPFTGPATALLKYMCKRLSSINCLKLRIMHCFREANRCWDALTRKGPIIQQDFVVYDSLPVDIFMLLYYNQIGMYYERIRPQTAGFLEQ